MDVRWVAKAANDLERISMYLWEDAPASAEWIVLAIYDAAESLAEMPYKGRVVGEADMRELTLRDIHYRITYRVAKDTVYILRIRHTAQKPLAH